MADCILVGNRTSGGGGSGIKMMTYTGDGALSKTLTFDAPVTTIYSAFCTYVNYGMKTTNSWLPIDFADITSANMTWVSLMYVSGSSSVNRSKVTKVDDHTLSVIPYSGSDAMNCLNSNGVQYTICYL